MLLIMLKIESFLYDTRNLSVFLCLPFKDMYVIFFFSLQMILQNSIWSTMHCSVSLRWMLKVKDTFFFRCLLLILPSLTGWEQDPNLYLSTMQKLETYSLVCFANDTEILNSWASEICRPIKVCSFFCQKTWKLS